MTDSAGALSPAVTLAILQPWANVADAIHERIARLAEPDPTQDVLWVGCGAGRSVLWWAERFGMRVVGVDPDHRAIEAAEAAARTTGLHSRVTFQAGPADDLPHETDVFDLTILYLLALRDVDDTHVIEQAARVARPTSRVVAVVPSWLQIPSDVDARRIESMGYRPRMIVEWKHLMREAGMVELAVEDAASDGTWIAGGLFGMLIRGWRMARWRGVRAVLGTGFSTLRRLVQARVLGLSIVRGVRWPHT